ncbi:DoxX family membrane protein [Candidatus Uhrbacteria bacterium]|nr:DoxX family membrane protein [Candidatus Uhrbacteria bacterium]
MAQYEHLVSFFLRSGLAVGFLYAALSSFLDPNAWVGFLPIEVRAVISGQALLALFSLYEIALSLWLLSGRAVRNAARASIATMTLIIIFNLPSLDIVFRDLVILAAAAALLAHSSKRA